ncbi:MAG: bifunctional proline dehydrogenase/L-glutamate gamma-semialdehyde dehydrogenase PutA [Steroidobacteraceae bacterium]
MSAAGFPFVTESAQHSQSSVAAAINGNYLGDEDQLVRRLADEARLGDAARRSVDAVASGLVRAVRERDASGSIDAFMREYSLSSREGVILMCLAEALLRIPDADTADSLIADKVASGAWASHLRDGESVLVNASTLGLMLTGRMIAVDADELRSPRSWYEKLVARIGEPVARAALRQAMKILAHQFVMGRDIEEAIVKADAAGGRYRYSFDMLGEAAITAADARRYADAYNHAIEQLGKACAGGNDLLARHGISIKLSALHPRFEFAQRARVHAELYPVLSQLVHAAREQQIAVTVDAEESERLQLSLELIARLFTEPGLQDFAGLGLAVQAYQKRAPAVLDWLASQARAQRRRITVRLVKGAYWDAEVKRAQERGFDDFPVYTRKANTDVSYLACARRLAGMTDVIYAQFATHNAHTVAYVSELFRNARGRYEFQRLHGMGEALYDIVLERSAQAACRVYAPVGPHRDLLPYLVRRLLENGANSSFVNRIVDEKLPVEAVVADPVADVDATLQLRHPAIALAAALYAPERRNSRGANLADDRVLARLQSACRDEAAESWRSGPVTSGEKVLRERASEPSFNPADRGQRTGVVSQASAEDVARAIALACAAQPAWDACGGVARAAILDRAADLFEQHHARLVARCVLEAGKCIPDALAEVREAVDFLRYYAAQARANFDSGAALPGPTGESNRLRLRGRGVFACISPWNFPVAIFVGQIAAALAAGNTVVAKPAEQTAHCAALAVELLLGAGLPADVLAFLPGDGARVGAAICADPRVAGVAFTGSTETAQSINRTLAGREGALGTLIAETGGLNVMIADSSALPEQLVIDTVQSGFNSAGQRCSALRILLVQADIAARVKQLLAGHMDELTVGNPALLATDIGPVIDEAARSMLEAHVASAIATAPWSHRVAPGAPAQPGFFVMPTAIEIASLGQIRREVFGPIVHVLPYRAADIDHLLGEINGLGFGLTLGVHSRIETFAERIARQVRVGNVYVNRNMIGAVVGTQPFGGCGLSGTGPKAGGPHYLQRFATEQTVTINTAAVGGNASLLTLQ